LLAALATPLVKLEGNDVRRIGEADDVLHLGNLADCFREAFDLPQDLRRVNIVGDHADDADLITAELPAYFIVIRFFRIIPWKQSLDRAVQTNMSGVRSKENREKKKEKENTLGSVNDESVDPVRHD
jgi:hypothetical protein